MQKGNIINYSQIKRARQKRTGLADHDYEVMHKDSPVYVQEEEDNRQWYIPAEIKNKTCFKLVLAGVCIIALFCILQSFFH